MSVYDDDGMGSLFNDNLNANIIGNELPSGSDDDEKAGADDDDQQAAIKVEPKKRSVRNPRPRLTIDLLKGPRGIHTIENHFKDIKFSGKGHENRDLNEVMKRLQHWAHRLYPNYGFGDILTNIERLSKKKPLQMHMNNYRQGLLKSQDANDGIVNDEDEVNEVAEEPFDEFDALIGEQIAISKLAATTPRTPYSVRSEYSVNTNAFTTPKMAEGNGAASTPYQYETPQPKSPRTAETPEPRMLSDSTFGQGAQLASEPQPGPSNYQEKPKLTSEQLALIAENRRKALERRRELAAARAQNLLK